MHGEKKARPLITTALIVCTLCSGGFAEDSTNNKIVIRSDETLFTTFAYITIGTFNMMSLSRISRMRRVKLKKLHPRRSRHHSQRSLFRCVGEDNPGIVSCQESMDLINAVPSDYSGGGIHPGGGTMTRYGQIIRVRPEKLEEYISLHRAVWPEVLEAIRQCHIRNYSIFLRDGLLFAYFEYHGTDFRADMAKMAADPKTREWWALTDPCQEPVASASPGEWWAPLEEVFHTD